MKSLMNRVRRAYAPPQMAGRPLLENIVQPLYSTVGIDNTTLPAEVNLFNYSRGQNVPGAGDFSGVSSSLWHTNMDTPGALASPKVFTVTGIRVHLSQIRASASNTPALVTSGVNETARTALAALDDHVLLFWSGLLRFTVGPKTYAQHPLWFFPSNVGIGGLNAVSEDNGTASTTVQQTMIAPHFAGQYWDFLQYPVVIAAQQSFGVNISWSWTTQPTMGSDRALTVFLDGILSREVS